MEIWSRLLGGSSQGKKFDNSSQQRLIRFKKVQDKLQLIWRRNNASVREVTPPEPLLYCIQDLRKILQNEVQTPAPHLCARHVSTFHTYSTIAQLAAIYPDDAIIQEALDIFKLLLDSEEGDFLKDKAFADALFGFMSTITAIVLPVETEVIAVELLFAITAKLRLQSELLLTWFRPNKKGWAFQSEVQQAQKGKEEFPLFYMILDYVYHDGRTGDFARTGLLYIIEAASHSAVLEQWIIESDLATLMASGLGALYSQLNRKLVLAYDEEHAPPILAVSQDTRTQPPNDAEKTTAPEFKAHLSTFLSYLVFWQDVLEHCGSSDIKQSLLDHFKFLFLQQLLYPSLIESSDRDGGSSVAVLTYLKCIIESIDHPELAEMLFSYLLAIPEEKIEEKPLTRPTALARRRRSQSLVASLSQGQEKPLPDLFNLDDLIIGNLRSNNQQTVVATLRLVNTMLRSHHQSDVSLIKMSGRVPSPSLRMLAAHEMNTDLLYRIVEKLAEWPDLGEAYNLHLEDAQNILETHPCAVRLLDPANGGHVAHVPVFSKVKPAHANSKPFEDPILDCLLALLDDFFLNEIDTNISLTNVFSTLACCPERSLDEWLLNDFARPLCSKEQDQMPSSSEVDENAGNEAEDEDKDEEDQLESSSDPIITVNQKPITPVFSSLDSLVKQVETFKMDVENFDMYLAERRHVLQVGDEVEKFVNDDLPRVRHSEDLEAGNHLQLKHGTHIGSISERLMSETSSTSPSSGANSPRGRQQQLASRSRISSKLDTLRVSASRSPSKTGTRNVSPSPLRLEMSADSPTKQSATSMEPADRLDQKIRIASKRQSQQNISDVRSDTSSMRSESVGPDVPTQDYRNVNLSHVLTNVIILQEFVLELVAILQVRASLFGEVRFD